MFNINGKILSARGVRNELKFLIWEGLHDVKCVLFYYDVINYVTAEEPYRLIRSARKLSSYLVRAKLCPIDRTVENVNITDSFTSSVTQNTYKINQLIVKIKLIVKINA